jgi:hypothetical protein
MAVTRKGADAQRLPPTTANSAKLGNAIARFAGDPKPEHRAALLETLMAGPLLMAIKELPEGFYPAASENGTVRFVTAEVPAEDAKAGEADPVGRVNRVVCGFSDIDALAAKAPAGVWVMLDPLVVLQWIVDTDMDGLLLDPHVHAPDAPALVTNEDARSVLGMPPGRRGKARRALSLGEEPENAIHGAVTRLLERSDLDSHVIVKEAKTGKFVLFARAIDDSVMMVVRASSLARDELERTQMLFDELAGDLEDLDGASGNAGESEDWADFQAIFSGDIGQAAKAAVKVFTWAFGFPPGFELEIEEH